LKEIAMTAENLIALRDVKDPKLQAAILELMGEYNDGLRELLEARKELVDSRNKYIELAQELLEVSQKYRALLKSSEPCCS
jgi:DNA-directed RNA polymerase subunit F